MGLKGDWKLRPSPLLKKQRTTKAECVKTCSISSEAVNRQRANRALGRGHLRPPAERDRAPLVAKHDVRAAPAFDFAEDKFPERLADLALHRLDVLLADRAAPANPTEDLQPRATELVLGLIRAARIAGASQEKFPSLID